jgi:VIT1/CCC1 family predicted Fe2+/Mn2+ transporter
VPPEHAFAASSIATALALFGVGASRCLVTTRGLFRSGAEMLAVGTVAAAVAYLAGSLLGRWIR